MKLYHSYIKERLNQELFLIPDIAFATYEINGSECFIVEIHVEKEFRKQGYARIMADEIVKIAKSHGCTHLRGSVLRRANGSDTSIKILEGYGMRKISETHGFVVLKKEI